MCNEGFERVVEENEEEEKRKGKRRRKRRQEGEKILRMEESRAGGRVSRWKQAGWINFGATVPEADA